MPLYDCMLLFKPHVNKVASLDLIVRVGKHVYGKNGVLTNVTSYGTVQLGYGIKKLDGRFYQGQLIQMTMMATPNINKELHYLNKEDRLLRWLLVKHRNVNVGSDSVNEFDKREAQRVFSSIFDDDDADDDDVSDLEDENEPEHKSTERIQEFV